jgi:hypothetical protein
LPAGNGTKYNLTAHDPQGRWANAVSYTFDSKPCDELEFTLRFSSGGWITGQLVDHDKNPVGSAEVFCVADDQLDNIYFDPTAIANNQGHFKLGPMRAGKYTIGQRQPNTITRADLDESSQRHVSVVEGKTTDAGESELPSTDPQK